MHILILVLGVQTRGGRKLLAGERGGRVVCLFGIDSKVGLVFPVISLLGSVSLGLIPGSGRSLGEGNGNPFQYSCLGNPMDREAWRVTVHGVAKSWTRLSD